MPSPRRSTSRRCKQVRRPVSRNVGGQPARLEDAKRPWSAGRSTCIRVLSRSSGPAGPSPTRSCVRAASFPLGRRRSPVGVAPSGCPPIGTHSFDSGPFTIRGAPPAARRHRHPLRAAALRQTGSDRGTGVPGPDPQPTVAVVRIQEWMRHSKRCTPGEKQCCRHRAARRNRRGREGPPGNPAHSGTDVSPSRSLRAWMQSPPSPERRTRSCLELVMLTGPGSHTGDRDQVLLGRNADLCRAERCGRQAVKGRLDRPRRAIRRLLQNERPTWVVPDRVLAGGPAVAGWRGPGCGRRHRRTAARSA